MVAENARLSLADLEIFDSKAPAGKKDRRFCCPICGTSKPLDEEHRSLSVNVETGAWQCHRCKATGLILEKQKRSHDYQDSPRRRQRAALDAAFGLHPSRSKPNAPDPDKQENLQAQLKGIRSFTGSPAEKYLLSRGIPSEVAKAARVKYSPKWGGGIFQTKTGIAATSGIGPAAVFYTFDREGNCVAAFGRSIEGSEKRTYGNRSLGVFSTAGAFECDLPIITEAPIDSLSFAACGFPSIALGGLSFPEWLPEMMIGKTVLIAFDSDQPGTPAAREVGKAVQKLASAIRMQGGSPKRLKPLVGKDWNDVLRDRGAEALTEWLQAELSAIAPKSTDEIEALKDVFDIQNEDDALHFGQDTCIHEDPIRSTSADPAEIEALAAAIREALADRSLPIQIRPGENIVDLDLYAMSEARAFLHRSSMMSRAARERLQLLGIDGGSSPCS